MDERIPTDADWRLTQAGDLDERYAYKTFAGKSAEAARVMFRENVLMRAEDLWYMPVVPFRFYMLAFKVYVLSDAVLEDECEAADAANAFLGLLQRKLEAARADISPILGELLPAAEFIAQNQDMYRAPVDIYGDFREQHERIRVLAGGA
jgi:hypothetical protein